ncbi:MAG: ETC complex I subunit [Alphaproteobacteria bacterium]|nr:ETC complex I subunit [Alphaproteobacteria bacterium]
MTEVRIHRPAKTAMQSGRGRTRRWAVEFAPRTPKEVDPLMGWTGSRDVTAPLRLLFDTREDAVHYCERKGLAYFVEEPNERQPRAKSYADNFRTDRFL